MSLAQPLFRPLAESLFTQSRSAGGGAPVSGSTWDAANKGAAITLSGGDLVATSIAGGSALATLSRSSGKRALRFVPSYAGDDLDEETGVGATALYDATGGAFLVPHGYALYGDGLLSDLGVNGSGPTYASGASVYLYLDLDTGKGWFDTVANGTASDREAGINPSFTFTPGPMFPAAEMYSADGVVAASVTLDPTYSSGTFAAWDS